MQYNIYQMSTPLRKMQNSRTIEPMAKKTAFFNPGVTVDLVIFTVEHSGLSILLIQRLDQPFKNSPALPGGFLHKDETTSEAAVRVLRDKAGIADVYIEQLFTFDKVRRDPRGQILSVTYFALVPKEKIKIFETEVTEHPRFTPISSLPSLAFDHNEIVTYAHKRLVDKVQYTNIIYSLMPRLFTLTHLQKTYESVLNKKIDKRNFRKRFAQLKLLKKTGKVERGGRQRPAALYTFAQRKLKAL